MLLFAEVSLAVCPWKRQNGIINLFVPVDFGKCHCLLRFFLLSGLNKVEYCPCFYLAVITQYVDGIAFTWFTSTSVSYVVVVTSSRSEASAATLRWNFSLMALMSHWGRISSFGCTIMMPESLAFLELVRQSASTVGVRWISVLVVTAVRFTVVTFNDLCRSLYTALGILFKNGLLWR